MKCEEAGGVYVQAIVPADRNIEKYLNIAVNWCSKGSRVACWNNVIF